MNYWEYAKPTYIENWACKLYNISIAQIDVPMTLQEAKDIVEIIWDNKQHDLTDLSNRITKALDKMPNGAYVRLGSRSPKDGFFNGIPKSTSSKDVLTSFINSERIFDDLCLAIKEDYTPHIWVRQWVDIPKWSEFRCFMVKRQLKGISQYNYFDGVLPEIIENHDSIKWAIEQFFPIFDEACHLDNVVFDVWVKKRSFENQTSWEVRLIEINPLFELTDPCLFNWHNPEDFNGQFKYITDNSQVKKPPMGLREILRGLSQDNKQ